MSVPAKNRTMTFTKVVEYELDFKVFRDNFMDEGTSKAEALAVWEKMLEQNGDKHDIANDYDSLDNDGYVPDWVDCDVEEWAQEAKDEIEENAKDELTDECRQSGCRNKVTPRMTDRNEMCSECEAARFK